MVNKPYAITCSVVAFYFPFLLMVLAYYRIYVTAREHARQIRVLQRAGTPADSRHQPDQHSTHRMKTETKAAKTLCIIMGCFCLCWAPFFVTNIVDPFINYTVPGKLWTAFLWLGYINSGLNPFLYAFLNKSFRRAFLIILCCGDERYRRPSILGQTVPCSTTTINGSTHVLRWVFVPQLLQNTLSHWKENFSWVFLRDYFCIAFEIADGLTVQKGGSRRSAQKSLGCSNHQCWYVPRYVLECTVPPEACSGNSWEEAVVVHACWKSYCFFWEEQFDLQGEHLAGGCPPFAPAEEPRCSHCHFSHSAFADPSAGAAAHERQRMALWSQGTWTPPTSHIHPLFHSTVLFARGEHLGCMWWDGSGLCAGTHPLLPAPHRAGEAEHWGREGGKVICSNIRMSCILWK